MLEQNLEQIITRFDGMAAEVDDAIARLDAARGDFPAVNLLKNARATETDGGGALVSPLNLYIDPSWATTASMRVLEHDHIDVPQVMSDFSPGYHNDPFNVIELTINANGSDSPIVGLVDSNVRGRVSDGVLAAFSYDVGITLNNHTVPTGELAHGFIRTRDMTGHLDAFRIYPSANNQKLFLMGPWVCAGAVSQAPLFTMRDNLYNAV